MGILQILCENVSMSIFVHLANLITFLRMLLSPFLCFLILHQSSTFESLVCLILFVVISLTDWIDGFFARKIKVSSFGKILDPIADKVLVFSVLLCFVSLNIFTVWSVIMLLFRDFLMSSLRILLSKKGIIYSANTLGKLKTVMQFLSIFGVLLGQVLQNEILWIIEFSKISIWISVILSFASLTKCIIENRIELKMLMLESL